MTDSGGHEREPTPEERRLAAYLAHTSSHAPWSEHLAHHRSPDPDEADRFRRGRRMLLAVAVPLVVILLVAEATDRLIGNAWLLAVIAAAAAWCFWGGFLVPHPIARERSFPAGAAELYFRHRSQAAFVCLTVLFGVVVFFGWREQHTLDDLARLVRLPPEIEEVIYVPDESVIAGMQAMITTLETAGRSGVGQSGGAAPLDLALERDADTPLHTYWLVHTRLQPDEVTAFYEEPGNRPGWDVSSRAAGYLMLQRGPERLLIFAGERWVDTAVMFRHSAPRH